MKNTFKKLPGHVLVEEFLTPYFPADLSDLSKRARIPYQRLFDLIRGNDKIDRKMAERLGAFYDNGTDFWLELQAKFERGETL